MGEKVASQSRGADGSESGVATPVARPERVRPVIEALVAQLGAQLSATRVIEHPGENGRAREQIVKSFLTNIVPEDFAVTSGFLIDADGQISRQIDLLIYRRGYHPVFRVGEVPLVPIEAAAAAIEVKAAIDSEADLDSALENLESVRRLDRTNHDQNYTLGPSTVGVRIIDSYETRVFTAAITQRSLTREVLAQKMLAYLRKRPRRFWPNAYVDIDAMHLAYAQVADEGHMSTNWDYDGSRFLTITQSEHPGFIAPLVEFAGSLLDFLRITPVIDYKPGSYLHLEGGQIRWWRLDDPEMPPLPQVTRTTG